MALKRSQLWALYRPFLGDLITRVKARSLSESDWRGVEYWLERALAEQDTKVSATSKGGDKRGKQRTAATSAREQDALRKAVAALRQMHASDDGVKRRTRADIARAIGIPYRLLPRLRVIERAANIEQD